MVMQRNTRLKWIKSKGNKNSVKFLKFFKMSTVLRDEWGVIKLYVTHTHLKKNIIFINWSIYQLRIFYSTLKIKQKKILRL